MIYILYILTYIYIYMAGMYRAKPCWAKMQTSIDRLARP